MVRGVLVAGGRGTRLGAHKARVAIAGVSLLQRALETLSRVADDLVVAAPESLALRLPESPRARRVFDRVDGEGPLAGAVAALEDGGFEMAVILGVDFPLMHAATLRALIARLEAHPELGAIVPAPRGRLQPLAAAYGRAFAAALVTAFEKGERSIVKAVEPLGPMVMSDDELADIPGAGESFFNLNTPEDLVEAARRIAARAVEP
jgi:molybdopterin-guanine dinucleotide biosynthesis protein A